MTKKSLRPLWVIAVALLAAAGGFLLAQQVRPKAENAGQLAAIHPLGKPLIPFSLPDLDNVTHSISEWQGKVMVINFWATWCAPCLEEIPMFVTMQETYGGRGLQIIGVAIDEPRKVADFRDTGARTIEWTKC